MNPPHSTPRSSLALVAACALAIVFAATMLRPGEAQAQSYGDDGRFTFGAAGRF